jgi:hypothetical protein
LLFDVLKRILRDREFNSNDEIEKVIASVWDDPTLDDVQSVFGNRMSPLAWVIKNGRERILE